MVKEILILFTLGSLAIRKYLQQQLHGLGPLKIRTHRWNVMYRASAGIQPRYHRFLVKVLHCKRISFRTQVFTKAHAPLQT